LNIKANRTCKWDVVKHYAKVCFFFSSYSFFCRLISEVAWPIVTKLIGHIYDFDGDPDLQMY